MANGKVITSDVRCQVPLHMGSLVVSVLFYVLDTPIDAVLGMPWLR